MCTKHERFFKMIPKNRIKR